MNVRVAVVALLVAASCGGDDGPEPDWAAHEAARRACIHFEGAIDYASEWSTGLEIIDEEAIPHLEEAARLNEAYLGLQSSGWAVRDAVFEKAPFNLAQYYAEFEELCADVHDLGADVPAKEPRPRDT